MFVGLFAAIYDVAKRYINKSKKSTKQASHLSAASFSASLLILASGLKYRREIFVAYILSRFIGAGTELFRNMKHTALVDRCIKNTLPPLAILALGACKAVSGPTPLM